MGGEYEIVEMKRDACNEKWIFVARPVPQKYVEFRCDNDTIEDEIWKLAHDGVQAHMEFVKGPDGKNILIRCTRARRLDEGDSSNDLMGEL